MNDAKKHSPFYEIIDGIVKEETGKSIEEQADLTQTREQGLASKTGQLCLKIHEDCLRTITLRLVQGRLRAATSLGDARGMRIAEACLERYQVAPKESLIAYWCGCTEGAPTLKLKKEIYAILDRQGKQCQGNTH